MFRPPARRHGSESQIAVGVVRELGRRKRTSETPSRWTHDIRVRHECSHDLSATPNIGTAATASLARASISRSGCRFTIVAAYAALPCAASSAKFANGSPIAVSVAVTRSSPKRSTVTRRELACGSCQKISNGQVKIVTIYRV